MKNIKEFLLRGIFFAGFGPIIYGLVILLIQYNNDIILDGIIIFKGIISTYMLAFIIAGMSIIWKEERLGLAIQILIHSLAVYLSYLLTYLVNGWITTNLSSILGFSLIFICAYVIIWFVIFIVEMKIAKKFNKQLR